MGDTILGAFPWNSAVEEAPYSHAELTPTQEWGTRTQLTSAN